MSRVSRTDKRGGPSKALREKRELRKVAQDERRIANRKAGGPTPWAVVKHERKVRRMKDDRVQMQPRNERGMIMYVDKETGGMRLKYDTKRAAHDAQVLAEMRAAEQAAIDLEKRTASTKAKQARARKPKVAPVTTRKSQ